ncbi:putative dynamin GTPase [Hypoxylon sp. EC38]|nr:putative dynamin GTPase [Hypoxylon sp. EC38]
MIMKKGDIPASALGSAESERILNKINKIRRNEVGDTFTLPQFVACGDQSSGKSSVLERLTGIPFLRRDGICTKFPIEVTFRHTSGSLAINAEIQPYHLRSPYAQAKIKDTCHWRLDDLSELSKAVNAAIHTIRSYGNGEFSAGKAFTGDVLRIEVTGPTRLYATFVDLPGLISVTNERQTKDDARFVQELVERYMADSRTMILAVLQASDDIENQRILQLAQKHDPERRRTLGIITKTDSVKRGAEQSILTVASNAGKYKLQPGYFILRNPSTRDLATRLNTEAYNQAETDFFSCWVWRKHRFDWKRAGVENLKEYLQGRIQDYIKRRIPSVRKEIREKMTKAEKELMALGMGPRTGSEIRSFLTNTSKRFHQLAQDACDGNYQGAGKNFFSDTKNQLRVKIHAASGAFDKYMLKNGEKRKVVAYLPQNMKEQNDTANNGRLLVTQEGMIAWADRIYAETRGREFHQGSRRIFFAELFHEQSSPWGSIAGAHIEYMFLMIASWVNSALRDIIVEENTRSYVKGLCDDGLAKLKKLAKEELEKLIGDEKRQPISHSHFYIDIKDKSQYDANPAVDKAEQTCNEGIVSLESYYEVARKTFVDNVCRQVIERHLVSGLPDIFCPEVVTALSSEVLQNLHPESQEKRLRRLKLHAMIQGYCDSFAVLEDLPS